MKLTLLLTTAFAALSVASPVLDERAKRKDLTDTLIANVKAIAAATKQLNNTLNTLKPNDPLGLQKVLEVQQDTGAINDAIKKATATANKSAPFSKKNSNHLSNTFLAFVPKVQSTLKNLRQHKKAFATTTVILDLSKQVEQTLVEQRALTKTFGNAVKDKLHAPFKSYAAIVNKQVLQSFDKAIAAFKQCTGVVCVPGIPGEE